MRRSLAGLLFGLAYACASLTISGFLLQRTAFNPDESSSAAHVILQDADIRKELVELIVNNSAGAVIPPGVADPPREIEKLRRKVNKVASGYYAGGEQFFTQIIHDSHARLIGDQSGPVQITGEMLIPIVRSEAAASIPTITLPVPEIRTLSLINHLLDWLVPILAIATILLGIAGYSTHPERETLLRTLAIGLLLLGVLTAILGYLIPRFLLPMVNKSPWAHIPALLADDSVGLLIGMELVLVGAAGALMAFSGVRRRRRRWSQPISTYRYAEERRWS